MIRKILVTVLSFSSISAYAGEFWFRASGRLFRADLPVDQASLPKLSREELIELLKHAPIREVNPANGEASPAGIPRDKNWCEKLDQGHWTEVKNSFPVIWCEHKASSNQWTEARK